MTGVAEVQFAPAQRPGVTVVVMAYNEVDNLSSAVEEIRSALRGIGEGTGEILIVDDGSTDGTGALADRIAGQEPIVRVVHHPANRGLGDVYCTGLSLAEREFVTFFPADGQFPASIIPEFVRHARDRDLVLGYLPQRGDSLVGRVLSWGQRALYRLLVGPLPRFQGVLMVRRAALSTLHLRSSGRAATVVFEMIMKLARARHRVVSVPTGYRPRVRGRSKVNNVRTVVANLSAMLAIRRRLRQSPPDRPSRALPIAALAVAVAVCVVVYQPLTREPFDILDFSEFLLLLQSGNGFWNRFAKMATYYAGQGRVNEVGYGVIAGCYQLFGLDPLGWQIVRSLQLVALPPAAFIVLRRFGASVPASLFGASLYAVGTIPAAAWLRQAGEPLGSLFMLAAASLAHGWADARRLGRRTFLAALCMIGMLLCKETLVAAMPFLCLVAACWTSDNRVVRPQSGRATAYFLAASGSACLVLGGALLWAASVRREDAYAALYGTSVITTPGLALRAALATLPVSFYTEVWKVVAFPPNFVFLVSVVFGLGLVVRNRAARYRALPQLAIAASLPVAGIFVYLPWPRYEPFYAIPFYFGVILGVALLVDAVATGGRARLVLLLCWCFVIVGSALNAFGVARYTRAGRQLNYAVAQQIAGYSPDDTVSIASAELTPQPWQNPAATFGRYVRALKLTTAPPVIVDVECKRGESATVQGWRANPISVVYVASCGEVPDAARIITESFRYFDWTSLRIESATQRVSVIERRHL